MILGEDESARLDREIDSSSTAISGINRGMMMMRTSFSHSVYFFLFVQSLDYNLSISLNSFATKKSSDLIRIKRTVIRMQIAFISASKYKFAIENCVKTFAISLVP